MGEKQTGGGAVFLHPKWMTVNLGTHSTIDGLVAAVLERGRRISKYTLSRLARASVSEVPGALDLVVVSGEELGFKLGEFKIGAPYGEIFRRALALGYAFCPAEAVLQLRFAYEEPDGEWLLIPVAGASESKNEINVDILSVGRDSDGAWICCLLDQAQGIWKGERFIFTRRHT